MKENERDKHLLDIGDAFWLFRIEVTRNVDIAHVAKHFEIVFYVVWPEGRKIEIDSVNEVLNHLLNVQINWADEQLLRWL